jgi:predicted ATP-grasp superfamily ATP-dependent carboligase
MRALILDQGLDRGALAGARALASAGWFVGSGTPMEHGLAACSRAVRRHHRMPAVGEGPEALVEAVNRAVAQEGYEIVFSCDDVGVLGLSRHRKRLAAIFPHGAHEGLMQGFDKLALMREAQRVGMAVPRTEQSAQAAFERPCPRGVVVKPRFTFLDGMEGHVRASIASTRQQACEQASQMRARGADPIVQERIVGPLMAFTAVADRQSRVVARLQQIADLTWPVGVGVSARAHTVPVDESLATLAARLLEGLGWFGIAQLQFILRDDGVPHLVDLNGRFYGSLALAVGAGANLPAIWAGLATDRPSRCGSQARPHVRYQWLAGDLRANCTDARGLRLLARALDSLGHAPGAIHGIWHASDPKPATRQLRSKALAWLRRR